MSLRRQIWVVLLSYLTRTGFRWAIISSLSGFSLVLLGVGCRMLLGLRVGDENPFSFLFLLGSMAMLMSLVGAHIIFFVHARQQLMGPMTRFMPNTRRANLIVAAGLFFGIVLALSWTFHDLDYFPGMVGIVSIFMILIAFAFCNPWLIPLPIGAILLLSYNPQTQIAAMEITQKFDVATMFHDETPLRMAYLEEHEHYVWALRGVLLLLNILALLMLERLSRPETTSFSPIRLITRIAKSWQRTSIAPTQQRHPFIESHFARSLHRRFAIHNWYTAAFLVVLMAMITLVVCRIGGTSDPIIALTATLAIIPGTLVAMGWRERWRCFEFETLYPVKQQQFISELLTVLLLDAVEFWIATLAGLLIPLIALRAEMLHEPHFWAAILVTAMFQFLWIGGIALAGQRRQTLPFVAALGVVTLAVLMTFDQLRRATPHVFPNRFVAIAAIEMLVGLLFLTAAIFTWRRQPSGTN